MLTSGPVALLFVCWLVPTLSEVIKNCLWMLSFQMQRFYWPLPFMCGCFPFPCLHAMASISGTVLCRNSEAQWATIEFFLGKAFILHHCVSCGFVTHASDMSSRVCIIKGQYTNWGDCMKDFSEIHQSKKNEYYPLSLTCRIWNGHWRRVKWLLGLRDRDGEMLMNFYL